MPVGWWIRWTAPLGCRDHFLDIVGVELDLDFLGFGQDRDGGGRGMDAALGLGDRDPFDLVRAALVTQLGKHTLAAHAENPQPAAALLGSLDVDLLERPPLDGGEPLVHRDDVAGPERGLVAADPGPDLDDDRAHGAIVGSHQLALHRFDHLLRPRPT